MKNFFSVKTEITVRFADADVMGHVNNARYLTYFEQGRVAYFKKLHALDLTGTDAKSIFSFIIAEIGIKFLSPATIDERLIVSIRVAEIRNKAFRMEYEIHEKKTKRAVASGYSVQVMYNYKTKKTFPITPGLKKKMMALEKK